MKARICSRLFLPVAILLLAVLVACQQADDSDSGSAAPVTGGSSQQPSARQLTGEERAAVAEFAEEYQAIEQEWAALRSGLDNWRSGLTECHPSAAQTALQDFAASFREVTEAARELPRTTATRELADLVIPAAEAEEAAFRNLRDRWQPGNTSFFESVEERRTEASAARKATEDRALELQVEFEAGPTRTEIVQAELFQEQFEDLEDAWEDYHRDYRQLLRVEPTLEVEEQIVRYDALAVSLSAVVELILGLEATEITEDLLDTLEDAAEDELDAVFAVAQALAEDENGEAMMTGGAMMERTSVVVDDAGAGGNDGLPAPPLQNGEGAPPVPPTGELPGSPPQAGEPAAPAPQPVTPGEPVPQQAVPAGPAPTIPSALAGATGGATVHDELDFAYQASVKALEEVSQGLDDIIDDESADHLVAVGDFNSAYDSLLTGWDSFHEEYDGWLESDGDCNRLAALRVLEGFSSEAAALANRVRDLPRAGFLLPVYTLLVDAAEREEGAMRALYSSWRPFAVDAFAAAEEERATVDRLRQQVGTGLQELAARP